MLIPSRAWGFLRSGLNGRFGVTVPNFGTGGSDGNPLDNDVDAGDEAAGVEFCPVFASQPSSGTLKVWTDGSLSLVGAADGTYVLPYDLYTFTPGDAASVDEGATTYTVTVGEAGTAVGLATETDTALALAALQALLVTAATETDTALALPAVSVQALAAALEVDTALPLAGAQALPITAATETDTALALSPVSARPVGLAVEVDTAFELAAFTPGAVVTAVEVDTALHLQGVQILPVGLAQEVDAALSLSSALTGAVGMAIEVDQALQLAGAQILAVGLAVEVDSALNPAEASLYVPPYAVLLQSTLPPQIVFRSTLP